MKVKSLASLTQWDRLVERRNIVLPKTTTAGVAFELKRKFIKMTVSRPNKSVPNFHRVNYKRNFGPHYIYPRVKHNLQVNDEILANFQGSGYLFSARIVAIEYEKYALIEFLNNGSRTNVLLTKVTRLRPLMDGDSVVISQQKCSKCPVSFYPATIEKALPNNRCDIIFSDRNRQQDVLPGTIGRNP